VHRIKPTVVLGSVADPDPGSDAFSSLNPWIWDGKHFRSGISDKHPGSYIQDLCNNFWIKNAFILRLFSGADTDPDPRCGFGYCFSL
jgi:hypothetical protein